MMDYQKAMCALLAVLVLGVCGASAGVKLVAVTDFEQGSKPVYNEESGKVLGFAAVLNNENWMGDYAAMAIMPGVMDVSSTMNNRAMLIKPGTMGKYKTTMVLEKVVDYSIWSNADVVTGNTQGQTDRQFKAVKSNRFRMVVDKTQMGGGSQAARIYEIELYMGDKKVNTSKAKITASHEFNAREACGMAFDGKSDTKWCASGQGNWVELAFEGDVAVDRWVVKHAEVGGENAAWNTADFKLVYVSGEKKHGAMPTIATKVSASPKAMRAAMQFSYMGDVENPHVVVDASLGQARGNGWVHIDAKNREIVGWNNDLFRGHPAPRPRDFSVYFVVSFSQEFKEYGVIAEGQSIEGTAYGSGNAVSGYVTFDPTVKGVTVAVGMSLISIDDARKNMKEL